MQPKDQKKLQDIEYFKLVALRGMGGGKGWKIFFLKVHIMPFNLFFVACKKL